MIFTDEARFLRRDPRLVDRVLEGPFAGLPGLAQCVRSVVQTPNCQRAWARFRFSTKLAFFRFSTVRPGRRRASPAEPAPRHAMAPTRGGHAGGIRPPRCAARRVRSWVLTLMSSIHAVAGATQNRTILLRRSNRPPAPSRSTSHLPPNVNHKRSSLEPAPLRAAPPRPKSTAWHLQRRTLEVACGSRADRVIDNSSGRSAAW